MASSVITKKPPGPGKHECQSVAVKALRLRAEEAIRVSRTSDHPPPGEEERIFHQLLLHQAELEMQNEDLGQTKEFLDAARAKYFGFYNLAPIGYFTLGERDIVMEANITSANLLGMEKTRITGQPFTRLITAGDQDIYHLFRKKLHETGTAQTCELRMARPDGVLCWVRLDASVSAYAENVPPACLIVMTDITQAKQIEAGLEKTRKELAAIKISADEASEYAESIINTVREPLIALDKNLRVVKVSRSFYDFFKVKPEETMGQLIYDLGNKQWNIPKLRELLETILPQRTSFDNYEVEHDFATIGQRTMLLNARQIERVLGMDRVILLAIEDITQAKQIEAGLEKTRKELAAIKISADEASEYAESIINTVREPLIALDQDLRVVKVSRSFYDFFKVKPEETMGQLIYDLGNKQWDIPKLRELLETILPQKTSFDNYEVEHDFATIGQRTMLLNARQIERVLGMDRVILLAIEDITERKQAEEMLNEAMRVLERANQESREFVNVASHDLKEPLRKVLSFADRLKTHLGPALDEKGADYMGRMIGAGDRMTLLIEDILAFSRITTTAKPFESVDLGTLLRETLGDLEISIEESGAVITIEKLPAITADRFQIGQLFQNLIGNSIKYRRKDVPCRIAIRAVFNDAEREMHGVRYAAGKLLFISVEDNGIGFDEKHAKRIFGVFQRLHNKSEYAGTGVGLAICKKIVERHNGEIEVKSEIDKGSTFTVVLPISPVSPVSLLHKAPINIGMK